MNSVRRSGRRQHGFTLIELLIALVIAGVLLSIALPSYAWAVRKSRRADAVTRLSQLQQAQERWRANQPSYAVALSDLGLPATVAGGHYTVAVAEAGDTSYVLTATTLADGPQASDDRCRTLLLEARHGALLYSSIDARGAVDSGPGNRCWNQ